MRLEHIQQETFESGILFSGIAALLPGCFNQFISRSIPDMVSEIIEKLFKPFCL